MEYEIRFYFPKSEYGKYYEQLNNIKELINNGRKYEKTSQYNHPSIEYDFYTKDIDGRFRIRNIVSEKDSKCKISWKRRIKDTSSGKINKEEEVELTILPQEYDNLIYIVKNVLHMIEVESYERYRTSFYNNEIEISLDEYPFGLALEIEALKIVNNPEKVIDKYIKLLDLNYSDSYKLSWDDKYEELCKEQNVVRYKHVLFNKEMPEVK